MTLYRWELDAFIKGRLLARIDKREDEAILAFNLRYVLNAKRPKFKKVSDREKEERKIEAAYNPQLTKTVNNKRLALYSKLSSVFSGERSTDGNI